MSKPVQYFSDEHLEHSKTLTPDQILEFLENFRQLHEPAQQSTAISIRIPFPLLAAFRTKAEQQGHRYQSRIKELMREWVEA